MLLYLDGMDMYGATADLTTKMQARIPWTYSAAGGKFGGKAITAAPDASQYATTLKSGILGSNECYGGFWFKSSAAPGALSPLGSALVGFADSQGVGVAGNGSHNAFLGIGTGGVMAWSDWRQAIRAWNATLGATNVCDNAFHWIEFYVKWATSGGVIQVYVDGNLEINVSGATAVTANPTLDRVNLMMCTSTATWTVDDIVIWDNAGSGLVASDFPLGPRRIITALPNGDTSDKDFSRSTGSDNYALVDDAAINQDTDYVESAISGDKDLYDFAALGVSPSSIKGVVVTACVKNPEGGSINGKLCVKSSSSEAQSSAKAVGVAYKCIQEIFKTNPSTSAAWTESGVNAAQFGLEVST